MWPRRRRPASAPRSGAWAGVVGLALAAMTCGGAEGPCGPLERLCARDLGWKFVSPRVDEAVEVDLDGDGEREQVVLDRTGEQLVVAWPEGQRTMLAFPAQMPVAIAALPGEVAVALSEPPVVVVFAADASGRLQRRREVVLRDEAAALVAADLAGDGAPELVATLPEEGVIAVIDPSTGTMREHPAGRSPLRLDVGDVDGDEHLDLVVVDAGLALQVFFGTGDGGLRAATASLASGSMQWIDLGDHDGDGDLDAFTRADSTQVLVHRNDGHGRFSSPTALPMAATGNDEDAAGLVVGPVAASGFFGVTVPSARGITTWFGKGSTWLGRLEESMQSAGTWVGGSDDGGLLIGGWGFVQWGAYASVGAAIEIWRDATVESSLYTSAVTTGHLDGDPLLDVAAISDSRLLVLRGRADRGLERIAELDLSVKPMGLTIADATGDGLADILVSDVTNVWLAQAGAGGSYVLRPPHQAAVLPYELVPVRTGPASPAAIAALSVPDGGGGYDGKGASLLRFAADGSVADEAPLGPWQDVFGIVPVDFDEDGVDELLMYARDEQAAVLAHMVPEGPNFVAAETHDLGALTGLEVDAFRPGGFAVGDLDGDGAVEAVISAYQAGVVVSGLASGTAAATVLPDIQPPHTLRDLDGDGRLDIASAIQSGSFYSQRGLGDGTFEPGIGRTSFVEGTAGAFAVGDAQFDVVTLSRSGIATHLMRPVARPVHTSSRWLVGMPYELEFGDIDGDGIDDVVFTAGDAAGGVSVLWGAETDPLARGRAINDGHLRGSLALGDLDDSDALGILTVSSPDGIIEVHPFRPDAREAPIVLPELTDAFVRSVKVADLDGDGLSDLVALLMREQAFVAVARGTGPLQFAPFVAVAEVDTYSSALDLGDVDGDRRADILVHSVEPGVNTLVRAEVDGAWSSPAALPGEVAMFGPPDAAGRVELVTQEGASFYRHDRGAPERRSLLQQRDAQDDAVLRRVADVDRDGRFDLAIADANGTHVWLRGEDGVAQVTLVDVPLEVVGFPDIDGDGRSDVVGTWLGVLFVRRTRP
ncbi:VCBS repeat-containing protein [Nannocystis sp. RBIL2]|uniref:FG-GAP repeat domain-containing protein n=1 Tax=Nannocystis sp. RBIL2 TaxID=2996788 RepID=UPI00226EF705|nr:VCBS repeat-containing protein [Nannocystis sp. RBIL2]MCY1064468.1 VCBS repeat-containing protein [Nannocystis sp. RBIL2]